MPPRPHTVRRAFTAVELLVLIGIIAVLLSIFIPYFMKVRETSNRAVCADHLRQIGWALNKYAENESSHQFPRVVYDSEVRPSGYVVFTGPDAFNPFTSNSAVQPSDVTASLWLLIRIGYLSNDPKTAVGLFTCPSASESADPLTDAQGTPVSPGQRSNFRDNDRLSYSYCVPFSSASRFHLTDSLPPKFVVMADKNPGVQGDSAVSGYDAGDSPFNLARANSHNHGRAGQNVLYATGTVLFETTPYCGVGGDNIYTAQSPTPLPLDHKQPKNVRGVVGRQFSPASADDSYLVPTAADLNSTQFPPPPKLPATAPSPTTTTVTAPPIPTTTSASTAATAPASTTSPASAPTTTTAPTSQPATIDTPE